MRDQNASGLVALACRERVAGRGGDVDLRAKLAVWESFHNLRRPHTALDGRTPCEVLREKLAS